MRYVARRVLVYLTEGEADLKQSASSPAPLDVVYDSGWLHVFDGHSLKSWPAHNVVGVDITLAHRPTF